MPIVLGTQSPTTTGFTIPGGQDLNTIFAANTGTYLGFNTGYICNGTDLTQIFAPTNQTTFNATGSYGITFSNGYTIVTFYGNGTIEISSKNSVKIGYIIVGGGGSGGYSNEVVGGVVGGGGGAGGGVNYSTISDSNTYLSPRTVYNITVGAGGIPDSSGNPSKGNPSSLSYLNSNILTALGGGGGSIFGSTTDGVSTQLSTGVYTISGTGAKGSYADFPGMNGGNGVSFTLSDLGINYSFSGGGGGGTGGDNYKGGSGGYQGGGNGGGENNGNITFASPGTFATGGGGGGSGFIQNGSGYYNIGAYGGSGTVVIYFS